MITIEKGSKSFYVGDSEANPLAEIAFTYLEEDTVRIDRTFVTEALRGKNVAKELLHKLIGWARDEHKKVIPLCKFAKAEMLKNKDYEDVLQQQDGDFSINSEM